MHFQSRDLNFTAYDCLHVRGQPPPPPPPPPTSERAPQSLCLHMYNLTCSLCWPLWCRTLPCVFVCRRSFWSMLGCVPFWAGTLLSMLHFVSVWWPFLRARMTSLGVLLGRTSLVVALGGRVRIVLVGGGPFGLRIILQTANKQSFLASFRLQWVLDLKFDKRHFIKPSNPPGFTQKHGHKILIPWPRTLRTGENN